MTAWLDLEKRFREIEAQLRGARLDHQTGDAGEYWSIAASFDRIATSRFEVICKYAGRKLLVADGTEQQFPEELRTSTDDATRWYRAMKLMSGHYEYGLVGFHKNHDGTYAGTIFTGHIHRPAAVAATLCLELSAMSTEPEFPSRPLTINVSGTNHHLNLSSTDNSVKTYSATTTTVFESLRAAVPDQVSTDLRTELLCRIEQMELAFGKPSFFSRYNDFIHSAANHLAVFYQPLQALLALLPK